MTSVSVRHITSWATVSSLPWWSESLTKNTKIPDLISIEGDFFHTFFPPLSPSLFVSPIALSIVRLLHVTFYFHLNAGTFLLAYDYNKKKGTMMLREELVLAK